MKLQWKSQGAGLIGESTFKGFERDISMNKTPIPIPTIVAWKSLDLTPSRYIALIEYAEIRDPIANILYI